MFLWHLLQMSICVFFVCVSGRWFLWKKNKQPKNPSWCKALRTRTVLIFCADLYKLMTKHCTTWKGVLLQTSWQLGSGQKYLSGHWQYVITRRRSIWSRCDTHRDLQNRVPYSPSKALPNLHFPSAESGESLFVWITFQGQHTGKKKVLFLPFWFSPFPLSPP